MNKLFVRDKSLILLALFALILGACKNPASSPSTPAKGRDANLTTLIVAAGTVQWPVTPTLDPAITNYAVSVPSGVSALVIGAGLSDSNAQIPASDISGLAADRITPLNAALTPQGITVTGLQDGSNVLRARVLAEDGSTEKTYELTINVVPSQITLAFDGTSVVEGSDLTGTISLAPIPVQDVTVSYSLSVNNNWSISTFVLAANQTGSATISAGESSASFSVPTIDNSAYDAPPPGLVVTVTGSTPSGAASGTPSATQPWVENDQTDVNILNPPSSVNEGSTALFIVRVAQTVPEAITVNYTITGLANPSDSSSLTPDSAWSTESTGSFTIPARTVTHLFRVVTVDNTEMEAFQQGFVLTFSSVSSANNYVALGTPVTATVNITDDE
ncbi:MAG: cadherin-like beta sandwich domain-containing protein [Spirochaetales bacterium]|nr:cadherin-like beta sandwich domain-containing protein [Spirochaetales bacterium]